jgi:aminopeptidase N
MATPGGASADDPYVPGQGNGGYDVTGYELDLAYRVTTNLLTGKARITAVATQDLSRLSLDLVGLRVQKVTVDGRPAHWVHRGAKLHVTPPAPIDDATAFAVDVRYSGNPRPAHSVWGEVGWEELTDGVLVAGQPSGAPTWFPCNDRPDQKAPFRVAITAASGYHVVANGALSSGRVRGSQTTWVYDQPEPMAPYLATLQIGRYETLDVAANPVAIVAVLPAEHQSAFEASFARQAQMMEVFVDRFGPYPFDSGYRVVVVDDVLEIPLEAQGLSIFGTNHLDGASERLIAHELSHQWFGNSLTASRWKDIWLHEGFACYAEWIWSEDSGGPTADELARQHHARLASLPQDLVLSDPGPLDMFDDRVYKRGALTLHALRLELGDDPFFSLLRRWARDHQHGTVTTESFVELAERAAERRLTDLFDRWLVDVGLPPLTTPRP